MVEGNIPFLIKGLHDLVQERSELRKDQALLVSWDEFQKLNELVNLGGRSSTGLWCFFACTRSLGEFHWRRPLDQVGDRKRAAILNVV